MEKGKTRSGGNPWTRFRDKHPGTAQFLVFFMLSNGITVLQMIIMPVFKSLFGMTDLVNTTFQILPERDGLGRHGYPYRGKQLVQILVQHLEENLLLGLEIVVQHGVSHSGPSGNFGRGSQRVSLFEKQLLGGDHDSTLGMSSLVSYFRLIHSTLLI